MCHPFNLEPEDLEAVELDFLQALGDEETAAVGGGTIFATTLALGEEGGCWYPRYPYFPSKPYPLPLPVETEPPVFTTQAVGEEGGGICPPFLSQF